jgi:hypothetical protein
MSAADFLFTHSPPSTLLASPSCFTSTVNLARFHLHPCSPPPSTLLASAPTLLAFTSVTAALYILFNSFQNYNKSPKSSAKRPSKLLEVVFFIVFTKKLQQNPMVLL